MVVFATCEGPLHVPDAMIRAINRHAERQADLTAACLDATGLFRSKPARIPAAFSLELAAVLELGLWERQDLRRHLDVDLPTFREAADHLAERCKNGLAEFTGPNSAPLSLQVLRVWMEYFVWDGPELLQTDVVVGELDEDKFIDILAEFVWTHRNELKYLIRGDKQK